MPSFEIEPTEAIQFSNNAARRSNKVTLTPRWPERNSIHLNGPLFDNATVIPRPKELKGMRIKVRPDETLHFSQGTLQHGATRQKEFRVYGRTRFILGRNLVDVTTMEDPSAMDFFQMAAQQFYLGHVDQDAFFEASLELFKSCREMQPMINKVTACFQQDKGHIALNIIKKAAATQPTSRL